MASGYQWSGESLSEALKLFYKAIDLDPHFASAYGRAAWCYIRNLAQGLIDRPTASAEAERLGRQAARLGKDDALALCAGGFALVGEMDCVYSSWATRVETGFLDEHLAALQRLTPFLALAIKSVALTRMTRTLMHTYLGRDAGRRVLSGRIMRGVADRIDAVLWFSDLRGFTRITDTAPEHVIPLLNDYADVMVSALHGYGGDVLKFIGDGVLAIFAVDDRERACDAALAAAVAARQGVAELNERRAADGLPTTDMYLGLHVGEVLYGNVGSTERLDFTVIGPAVNEVSRIAAMCRSVEQPMLVSAAFAAVGNNKSRLISVGRYALRGVGAAQELFTLDPDNQVCRA
jgi:adenylate cyclase